MREEGAADEAQIDPVHFEGGDHLLDERGHEYADFWERIAGLLDWGSLRRYLTAFGMDFEEPPIRQLPHGRDIAEDGQTEHRVEPHTHVVKVLCHHALRHQVAGGKIAERLAGHLLSGHIPVVRGDHGDGDRVAVAQEDAALRGVVGPIAVVEGPEHFADVGMAVALDHVQEVLPRRVLVGIEEGPAVDRGLDQARIPALCMLNSLLAERDKLHIREVGFLAEGAAVLGEDQRAAGEIHLLDESLMKERAVPVQLGLRFLDPDGGGVVVQPDPDARARIIVVVWVPVADIDAVPSGHVEGQADFGRPDGRAGADHSPARDFCIAGLVGKAVPGIFPRLRR